MADGQSGWSWFDWTEDRTVGGMPSRVRLPDEKRVLKAFARALSGEDGQIVADYLRALTFERHLGPQVTDAYLRHLEGQRHLVAHILSLAERGQRGGP